MDSFVWPYPPEFLWPKHLQVQAHTFYVWFTFPNIYSYSLYGSHTIPSDAAVRQALIKWAGVGHNFRRGGAHYIPKVLPSFPGVGQCV